MESNTEKSDKDKKAITIWVAIEKSWKIKD